MRHINMDQWVMSVKNGKKRAAIPIMTHPGIEFTGKRVIDAVTNGQIHYQSIKAVTDNYPASAATIIMDLTVEAEAFGCSINFSDHEVPAVYGRLISDHAAVTNLKIPGMQAGRIQEYLKASHLAATHITDRPVFGGCIGPFSLAGRLFDMTEIMTEAIMNPGTIQILLEKCTQFLIQYAREMKKTGVNGIIIAEPAAGLLDESMCEEFSSVFVKQIVGDVQDENFMVILHNCGNSGHLTQSMIKTGAKALHFGNRIDMVQTLKELPDHILVMGNLDPVAVFKMSTTEQVIEITSNLLNATKEYSNFVISSGCDTPPGVPAENIEAFFNTVASWNQNLITSKQLIY
jgi:uroporphyrinogen decarboxylase